MSNHFPCPGGCNELADECMTRGCGSPLGAFQIVDPIGSVRCQHLESHWIGVGQWEYEPQLWRCDDCGDTFTRPDDLGITVTEVEGCRCPWMVSGPDLTAHRGGLGGLHFVDREDAEDYAEYKREQARA